MKSLLTISLLMSSLCFADAFDKNSFKSLLTQKKATLESVNVGMSKKLVTTAKFSTDVGDCEYTLTALQTVMRIEGDKIIVLSQDEFVPANSKACEEAEAVGYKESMLFFESKPSLANDLADLEASVVTAISSNGNIVTMSVEGDVTVKYDLTKSSFKNLISTEGKDYKITSTDMKDLDVNSVDLSNILFCENNDGDNEDCSQGNYSDILF